MQFSNEEREENWLRETGEKMGWPCVPILLDGIGYDMDDCCDHGSSDCPATMHRVDTCGMTKEELRDDLSFKWRLR